MSDTHLPFPTCSKPCRLNPKIGGPMMAEACDEIVQILTEERFMNKMVVILAGYEQQVWRFPSFQTSHRVGTCAV